MGPKKNLQQNTVCLEQQIYASQENFTHLLVVMVETFRRSGRPIIKKVGPLLVLQSGNISNTSLPFREGRQYSETIISVYIIGNIHLLCLPTDYYFLHSILGLLREVQLIFINGIFFCSMQTYVRNSCLAVDIYRTGTQFVLLIF